MLVVSHRCVCLLVRVWALDVWGELVPSKIFNPRAPFPVLKAGHSVSYSCVCDVDREWVNGVGFFLFFLNSCLASVLCTSFMYYTSAPEDVGQHLVILQIPYFNKTITLGILKLSILWSIVFLLGGVSS